MKRRAGKPSPSPASAQQLTPTERVHIAFIAQLHDGKLGRYFPDGVFRGYTDGGGSDRRRRSRRARGQAAKQARKRQRAR